MLLSEKALLYQHHLTLSLHFSQEVSVEAAVAEDVAMTNCSMNHCRIHTDSSFEKNGQTFWKFEEASVAEGEGCFSLPKELTLDALPVGRRLIPVETFENLL